MIDVESTSETVTMIRTAHGRAIPEKQKSLDKAGLRYRKVYQALVVRQQAGDFSYHDDPAADVSDVLGINTRA